MQCPQAPPPPPPPPPPPGGGGGGCSARKRRPLTPGPSPPVGRGERIFTAATPTARIPPAPAPSTTHKTAPARFAPAAPSSQKGQVSVRVDQPGRPANTHRRF